MTPRLPRPRIPAWIAGLLSLPGERGRPIRLPLVAGRGGWGGSSSSSRWVRAPLAQFGGRGICGWDEWSPSSFPTPSWSTARMTSSGSTAKRGPLPSYATPVSSVFTRSSFTTAYRSWYPTSWWERPLRDLLAQRRLSHAEAATLATKVAEALAYAHTLGAIHRDIKPANIMVDRESAGTGSEEPRACPKDADEGPGPLGEPRIVDFGLAFCDKDGIRSTLRGHLVGTPAYMSPEQADGSPDALDGRADIYSLGVVLYEALAGTLPFSGTRSEVLNKLATRRAAPPPANRPDDLPRPGDDLPQGDGQGSARAVRHRAGAGR